MSLMVPLSQAQIKAAGTIYTHLEQWKLIDTVLSSLGRKYPDNNLESTLLKAVVINELYATGVLSIQVAAKHIYEILNDNNIDKRNP